MHSPKINSPGAFSLSPSQSVGQVRGFLSEVQHKCFQRNSSKREVSKPSSTAALQICNSEKVFYLSGKTKRLPQLQPLLPHTQTYGIGSFFKLTQDPNANTCPLCLKDFPKNTSDHYLVKIIKPRKFVLAEFETYLIHFELFCSGFIIQTCVHLLGSGNVGMTVGFLVSKVLKHLTLSPGLYFSHYTIQKEARTSHFAAKFYK